MAANVNDLINGAYVTIFNRAADPQGANTFWPTFLGLAPTAPGTVDLATKLGDAFFQVPAGNQAFNALYPASLSNSQFITQLYLNLGNSVPDAQGLQFWLGQLTAPGATRAGVAADISFVLQTFDPTAASFLALTPDQRQAALDRAATYQNKIAVSEALAATNNSAFNPTAVGDAAYKGEVAILQGINQTDASRNIALQQIDAANKASNPALLVGQGLTIFLTPGIDVPPATETSQNNVIYFAPDVLQAGLTVPTLNPGDQLVDHGKNGTLKIISGGGENLTGWTSNGVANIDFSNANTLKFGATTLDASGATGLTKVLTHDNFAAVTVTNVPNQVELDVSGATQGITLNYQNAVTGTQDLGLKNVSQTVAGITFGTNSPSKLAVHLTGSNTLVGITDANLTNLTVDSTDTGTSNLGTISNLGSNKLVSVDLTGAQGPLTTKFANDSFSDTAVISLGPNDTLTIGESNKAGHTRDNINVNGNGGVYNITLGNQDDHINLGAHSVADTLTFMHPWGANQAVGSVAPIPEQVTNANLSVDNLQFSVLGFASAIVNPAVGNVGVVQPGHSSTLLHAGVTFPPGAFPGTAASAVVAGEAVAQYVYDGLPTGIGTHIMQPGDNFIRDVNLTHTTAATVATAIFGGGALASIRYGTGPHPAGEFLVAYQGTDGVHIAEAQVTAQLGAGFSDTFATPGVTANVHDIIDLVGTNISQIPTAHISFVA